VLKLIRRVGFPLWLQGAWYRPDLGTVQRSGREEKNLTLVKFRSVDFVSSHHVSGWTSRLGSLA